MAVAQIKSKEAKARAAMSGGKGKRKKWSKGKNREKLNNAVLFDQATFDKMEKDIPKMKLITISGVSERMKMTGSLARVAIRLLTEKNLIKPIVHHGAQLIYTRA